MPVAVVEVANVRKAGALLKNALEVYVRPYVRCLALKHNTDMFMYVACVV